MFAGYDLFQGGGDPPDSGRVNPQSSAARLSLTGCIRIWPASRITPGDGAGILETRTRPARVIPGFSHEPRWRTTCMLKKFYSSEDSGTGRRIAPRPTYRRRCRRSFPRGILWQQAQYLEVDNAPFGVLISSQGDRMLMAHSVEGRFPFLDADVMEFCNSLRRR